MKYPHTNQALANKDKSFILSIMNGLGENYWFPLQKYLQANTELVKTFPAFLLEQEHIVIYVGRTHLAIEYFGRELTSELPKSKTVKVTHYDFTDKETNFFEDIVGFKFESTAIPFTLPLPQYSDDWICPTNKGMDKLIELKWNWIAQNSIMSINGPGFHVEKDKFTRLVNARFFDADENGLKTRHIKWIDFLPLEIVNETETQHEIIISLSYLSSLVEHDAHYCYPLPEKDDYKYNKLPQINRFIELIGNSKTTEVELTTFLEQSENRFILTMGFCAKEINSQLSLEWQSQDKNGIKPDFLIVKPNGFADIVEFKLPKLKSSSVVGTNNRETFSSEINSYISQTRVYKEYFEDPNNRNWVKEKFNLNVRYPKRYLVVGRRWDFSNDVWKEIIDDYKDIEILTFDELIDGVVSQFYM